MGYVEKEKKISKEKNYFSQAKKEERTER